MNACNLSELAQNADTLLIDVVDSEERQEQARLKALFNNIVDDIKTVLVHDSQFVTHWPVSFGKDSFLTLCAGLEAHRQCIAEGSIEASRPMLVNTVDTGVESIPMKMFVAFASKRLICYAQKHKINLHFELVQPPMHDHYFIRWCSASKLIPSVLRKGDCSVILKVDPSESYLKRIMTQISETKDMEQYANSPRLTCVGSRSEEGARRRRNMAKQGLTGRSFKDIQAEFESLEHAPGNKAFKLAPIQHLTDDDVFELIGLCGQDPLIPSLLNDEHPLIPSFLDNGALLIELYGNGSADVCELATGKNKQGAGCSGKARYGCYTCTIASDKSSQALTRYERWNALGADNALRVRDYLSRLSADNSKRAFHAKAFCPVTYGRILLQPNCLKSRYLEKIVWYASQLAIDSIETAKTFRKLVASNREMEFSGYRDIAEDTLMHPKAKKQMLEMYKEQAQKPLFECFSLKHAVMLSAKWSLDGITAAPYRPLAIWRNVSQGQRVAWPKTNAEYTALHGPIVLDRQLPDAVALPVLLEDKITPKEFAESEFDLYDLWERPTHYRQLTEKDHNCSEFDIPKQGQSIKVTHRHQLQISNEATGAQLLCFTSDAKLCHYAYLSIQETQTLSITIGQKKAPQALVELMQPDIDALLYDQLTLQLDSLQNHVETMTFASEHEAEAFIESAIQEFNQVRNTTLSLPYFQSKTLSKVPKANITKVTRSFASTPRTFEMKGGRRIAKNTRLRTYGLNTEPKLERATLRSVTMQSLNFEVKPTNHVPLKDDPLRCSDRLMSTSNIDFYEKEFCFWLHHGGLTRALQSHDDYWQARLANRRGRGSIREYACGFVAEELFHTAGLSVQSSYFAQLNALIQRTMLFNDIGAYQFSDLSLKEIQSHPAMIPMKQHRHDKAEVLLEVRSIKNHRRKAARNAIESPFSMAALTQAAEVWLTMWAQHCEMTLVLGMEGRLNSVFFDSTVNLVERSNAARSWLRYYSDIDSLDRLVLELAGQHSQRQLTSQPKMMSTLFTALSPIQQRTNQTVTRLITQYQNKLQTLRDYREKHFNAEGKVDCIEAMRDDWKTMMTFLHDDVDRYLAFVPETKRNADNLKRLLDNVIDYLTSELAFINVQLAQLQQALDNAPEKAIKNMTLSQRLMINF